LIDQFNITINFTKPARKKILARPILLGEMMPGDEEMRREPPSLSQSILVVTNLKKWRKNGLSSPTQNVLFMSTDNFTPLAVEALAPNIIFTLPDVEEADTVRLIEQLVKIDYVGCFIMFANKQDKRSAIFAKDLDGEASFSIKLFASDALEAGGKSDFQTLKQSLTKSWEELCEQYSMAGDALPALSAITILQKYANEIEDMAFSLAGSVESDVVSELIAIAARTSKVAKNLNDNRQK